MNGVKTDLKCFHFLLLSGYSGSTENLSGTGGGLQRAPSLPRSYRQRSGIPVLSRESRF
jgi:hypothetical protein